MANPPPAGPAQPFKNPYGPANDGVTFVNTSPNPAPRRMASAAS